VTGGAGFLGSHLCDRLVRDGWDVLALDSLVTGGYHNVDHLMDHERFELQVLDVTDTWHVGKKADAIFHLASIASPKAYHDAPIATMRTGAQGTENAIDQAQDNGAVFILASTSEVYGDPEVHPQVESYNGNVDPVGPRSMYDESKRYGEAMVMAYVRKYGTNAHIARIFNTYGPRMALYDGRVVSTFIRQALTGEAITVEGDGMHTRSFCYVDDLVDGLVRMLDLEPDIGPINLGNPEEVTVQYLAELVKAMTDSDSEIINVPEAPSDPTRRCPDITRAKAILRWKPTTKLEDGLEEYIAWAKSLK